MKTIENISDLAQEEHAIMIKCWDLSESEQGAQANTYIDLFTRLLAQIPTCIHYNKYGQPTKEQMTKSIFIDYADTLSKCINSFSDKFDETANLKELMPLLDLFGFVTNFINDLDRLAHKIRKEG